MHMYILQKSTVGWRTRALEAVNDEMVALTLSTACSLIALREFK